jgi:hypothetical protein
MRFRGLLLAAAISAVLAAGQRGGPGRAGGNGGRGPAPITVYDPRGNYYPGFPGAGELCFGAGLCNFPYYSVPPMADAPPAEPAMTMMPPPPPPAPVIQLRNEPPAFVPLHLANPVPVPAVRDEYPALIVLKTGWVYSVRSYSLGKKTLSFVTTQGDRLSVPSSQLDRLYPKTR